MCIIYTCCYFPNFSFFNFIRGIYESAPFPRICPSRRGNRHVIFYCMWLQLIIFLEGLSSSLLPMCPYQFNLFCLRNVDISHTLASSRMTWFLTWSFLVLPLIHRTSSFPPQASCSRISFWPPNNQLHMFLFALIKLSAASMVVDVTLCSSIWNEYLPQLPECCYCIQFIIP